MLYLCHAELEARVHFRGLFSKLHIQVVGTLPPVCISSPSLSLSLSQGAERTRFTEVLSHNYCLQLLEQFHVTLEPLDGETSFQSYIVEQHELLNGA